MAFDQNSMPMNLRPLNTARTVVDDSRVAPVTTSSGRNIEGFYGNPSRDPSSPSAIPVYYPATVSDSGIVGLGYGNAPVPGVGGWVQRVQPLPAAVIGAPVATSPAVAAPVVIPPAEFCNSPKFGNRVGNNNSDQASDEGGDGSVSGKKVKLLCSFGGKIMPRPNDGALRYVGGHTRIISVRENVSFNELVQKMADSYGQNVVIKYQLPEEDLDALVSVSTPEDLENMMEEYEKLVERSPDGSAKLRVFLFSASEVDSSSAAVQMGDSHESGQRYIEAVNGIVGGTVGGITRKESIASATSTQNSDLSGTEAVDSTGHGQVDIAGVTSTGGLSPRNNFTASQETEPRLVYLDPSPPIHVEASNTPVGIQLVTSHPPVLSTQPVVVQPQQQVGFPPRAPYVQAYADPQQEALNRTGYVQYPSMMGFPGQLLGHVFTQQQYRDNVVNATPHQFIPAVHMSMAPSSYANLQPTAVRPIVQPQQVRMERFPDENYGQRVVQLPGDQSYNAYHTHLSQPPTVVGAHGWHQAQQTEQVGFSDGWVPQQQVVFSDKLARYEDCYMCQKALPHAHSDTLAQGQRDSPTTTSDVRMVYHSLQSEDTIRGQPVSTAALSSPLVEGIAENQVSVAPPSSLGHSDYEGKKPVYVGVVASQNTDDGTYLQRDNNRDHLQASVPQYVAGSSQSPNSEFMGTAPQLYHENVPSQYKAKQDALHNKATNIASVGDSSCVASDYLVQGSPDEHSGKLPGFVSKEGVLESSVAYDQLRKIDSRMENLGVRPSEVVFNNDQGMSHADVPKQEDLMDNRVHHIAGREIYIDNAFTNPQMVLDPRHYKQNEMSSSPSNEVPYSCNEVPYSYEVTQPPLVANPGYLERPRIDSVQVTEGNTPIGEVKGNSPKFQPNIASDVEASRIDVNNPYNISRVNRVGDMQDNSNSLFSSQDPWNLRHDTHFPPPRPNKILTRKEGHARDPFADNRFGNNGESPMGYVDGFIRELPPDDGVYLASGNLDADYTSQSAKGSEEEHIKQELQAVAEGVAASVLQTSINSRSAPEANQDSNVQNNKEVLHMSKAESKPPGSANVGFPVSDGIGRLQIIKNSDLEELRELGSGTFGTVYHGKWRGSDVAIKRINDRCFAGKASEQERMRDDFWNEAIKLADLHHPNVVAFYGVVLDGPGGSVATVTEYMVNGSLRTALLKNEKNLDKRKRLLIAMDVAFGMEYLHGKNIVHFDLKSDNLLVNLRDPHRPICKVGDLGLSKVKCQTLISGGVRGTLPWMAPELLNGSSSLVSEKVDVFSFGIVLWELLTGQEPYQDLHYGAIIGGIVSNTLRPHVPDSCDLEWRSLMESCWCAEPSERPNFTEVANQLRTMAAKVPPKVQAQQQIPSTQPQVRT